MRTLGEGGFGIVYEAEQSRPVRRTVALKLLKPGVASDEVLSRFEGERQALARMEHPSVAKVLDAGVTEDGRPYFAMEFVRGDPILKFADSANLGIRERLELMIRVCEAVQHAHAKGVVHRDLKPANILCMRTEGGLLPKVIDFGIAKATGERLVDSAMVTLGAATLASFGDVLEIGVAVEKVGTSSATFLYEGRKVGGGDAPAVRGKIVVACIDMATMRSQPIPERYRAVFEKHRAG